MKTLLESKTFWIACAQAVGGVLLVVFTQLHVEGGTLVVKSFLDIILRMNTDTAITSVV